MSEVRFRPEAAACRLILGHGRFTHELFWRAQLQHTKLERVVDAGVEMVVVGMELQAVVNGQNPVSCSVPVSFRLSWPGLGAAGSCCARLNGAS